jgi:hypothetical protein
MFVELSLSLSLSLSLTWSNRVSNPHCLIHLQLTKEQNTCRPPIRRWVVSERKAHPNDPIIPCYQKVSINKNGPKKKKKKKKKKEKIFLSNDLEREG